VVVCTFFKRDTSHSMNSYWLCEDLGKEAMVDSAAERFQPQMMMWALPCVERAKAWAVAWPIPEVPPTKRAVGG
jgi:hypothetical protein